MTEIDAHEKNKGSAEITEELRRKIFWLLMSARIECFVCPSPMAIWGLTDKIIDIVKDDQ